MVTHSKDTIEYNEIKKIYKRVRGTPITAERMSKIKFNLASLEQALAFQVIHMDKRFLNCEYVACNGLQIKSTNCSHITDLGIIYLQGNVDENDLNISALYLFS